MERGGRVDEKDKKCSCCGKKLGEDEGIPFERTLLCQECFPIVEASRDTH
ncbi:hypothetical protein [Thermodesulforhabdus norvegica]|uniref:Uncharacterized protein n=1 Tax=Thermodesulforhabdus norvegica TaxID=39841 RepID=A0A1I4T8H6_9BACT|nr:hypothetical protein [Thermodesulforhabdus norvegica]SFM72870.1 hypothetical protein SAMN05660836_01281 [Thermodesulforhabdus norvegica]